LNENAPPGQLLKRWATLLIARRKVFITAVIILFFDVAMSQTAQRAPLPCTPPTRSDTHPWDYEREVLSSFPWDSPHPRFFGAFRDKTWDYELVLYRDTKGFFGELHSPVLEADSPTSRLYNVAFDAKTGTLQFQARFRDGQLLFSGLLRGLNVRGNVTRDARTQRVLLRRLRRYEFSWPYRSRAQFDCDMTLNHRY
jgi:hypothetical protein